MPLGTEVDLGPGDFVLDRDPAAPRKWAQPPTQFSAHVYCGQMAGWMKTPLGTETDLGPDERLNVQHKLGLTQDCLVSVYN